MQVADAGGDAGPGRLGGLGCGGGTGRDLTRGRGEFLAGFGFTELDEFALAITSSKKLVYPALKFVTAAVVPSTIARVSFVS